MIERLIAFLGPAFQVAGYPIVGTAVLLESSIFLGLFVPGDVVVAVAGIYASRGDLALPAVIGVAAAGAVGGESVGFWLGRRYGEPLLTKLPGARRLAAKLDEARRFTDKHGGKTVMIGRFATGAGVFVPFTAGMTGMAFPRFLAFAVPAIAVWATAVAVLGYAFGRQVGVVERILSRFGWMMLLVGVLGVGVYAWRRKRNRPAARFSRP